MKRITKKSVTLLLSVFMLTLLLGMSASAKTYENKIIAAKNLYKKILLTACPKDDLVSFKISNKIGKLSVSKTKRNGWIALYLKPKKTGKTTVTLKFKDPETGETHTNKMKVTVYNYKNPFKSFKIGKKNYASKFKKRQTVEKVGPASGKLKIKLKKGWKIKSILHQDMSSTVLRSTKVKNKQFIDLTSKAYITIILKNKKYGIEECFSLLRFAAPRSKLADIL